MQIGMIGLGRMGANMVRRLIRGGHACVVHDGSAAAPPTPGREQRRSTAEKGYLHCGPNGAGHFVKMVHNGIEYGLMAAYAEGLNILRHADVGKRTRATDAETTPLRDPTYYQYDFDLADIAEVWRRGSVVASWLLDLTAAALASDPRLQRFTGRVSDSGAGRWTLDAAVDEGVPAHVLAASLFERFSSRGEAEFRTVCSPPCDSSSAATSRRSHDARAFRRVRLLRRDRRPGLQED